MLPGVHYWRGIREALAHKGVEVITSSVPPSGSIEARAARLAENIAEKAHGKSVNIIAYVAYSAVVLRQCTDMIITDIAWYECKAQHWCRD